MKPPPPIPAECAFTTPTHKAIAIAASTTFPCFSSKMLAPYSEHLLKSAATDAVLNLRGSADFGKVDLEEIKHIIFDVNF